MTSWINPLIGAPAGILALLAALLIKKHHPDIQRINWEWVHAALLILAGIGLADPLGTVLGWIIHLFAGWIVKLPSLWPNLGSWFSTFVHALVVALPWCVVLGLALTLVLHMIPRFGAIRRSTAWVGLMTPAAFVMIFAVIGQPGMGG